MLQIHCPYCRETREEEEFSCAGEAHIQRPPEPQSTSDEEWGDYLFFRKNPRGIHHEMWQHAAGCRRYFNVTRDTVSYQVLESYPMGSRPGVHAAQQDVGDSVVEPQ
jgi:sarcosine oxidase subunit delta